MADARSVIVVDSTGAPLTSGTPGVQAFDATTGASRTAPTVAHVAAAPGTWAFTCTDDDETTGTVVLVDFGAGNLPRWAEFDCFKADGSNQFWSFPIVGADGSAWAGAAPTFGGYTGGVTPTLTAMTGAATALYTAAPSAADITAGAEGRVDGPAGSAQPYWSVSTEPQVSSSAPNVPASPGVAPDALAVQALQEYLRRHLPAKVAQLNALRAAVLKSALVEPFTIPAGAVLRLSATSQEVAPTDVTLAAGVRTSAQVAADITAAAVPGLTASSDSAGRLVLTADAAPATGAPSVVVVARDMGATGSNAAFGWADGGEHFEVPALVSPSWRGIVDGRPLTAPDMGQGFWLLLGNRTVRPTHPGIRRDTWNVSLSVEVWRPFSAHVHRSREAISSCVRAVREVLEAGDGRYLGRQGAGDVQLVTVTDVTINGEPLSFTESPGILFDFARLTLNVRVFQRPD